MVLCAAASQEYTLGRAGGDGVGGPAARPRTPHAPRAFEPTPPAAGPGERGSTVYARRRRHLLAHLHVERCQQFVLWTGRDDGRAGHVPTFPPAGRASAKSGHRTTISLCKIRGLLGDLGPHSGGGSRVKVASENVRPGLHFFTSHHSHGTLPPGRPTRSPAPIAAAGSRVWAAGKRLERRGGGSGPRRHRRAPIVRAPLPVFRVPSRWLVLASTGSSIAVPQRSGSGRRPDVSAVRVPVAATASPPRLLRGANALACVGGPGRVPDEATAASPFHCGGGGGGLGGQRVGRRRPSHRDGCNAVSPRGGPAS